MKRLREELSDIEGEFVIEYVGYFNSFSIFYVAGGTSVEICGKMGEKTIARKVCKFLNDYEGKIK